jgi:hypothetical protein
MRVDLFILEYNYLAFTIPRVINTAVHPNRRDASTEGAHNVRLSYKLALIHVAEAVC